MGLLEKFDRFLHRHSLEHTHTHYPDGGHLIVRKELPKKEQEKTT
jgi:hypothetical protein